MARTKQTARRSTGGPPHHGPKPPATKPKIPKAKAPVKYIIHKKDGTQKKVRMAVKSKRGYEPGTSTRNHYNNAVNRHYSIRGNPDSKKNKYAVIEEHDE
jgi:hypothetical protein